MSLDMLRKPNSRKKGLKMLVYGQSGTGKTVLGLSFPKIVAVDSEDGYAWYEGTDRAKNIVGILDTQSFEDLSNLLDDLEDSIDEFDTLIVDSETKIHENIQEALIEVEESRALRKGKDVLDANLSIRSYGKIKQLESRLQNLKVKLASQGINIVSIAQAQDEMKDMGNNKRIKIGEKPNMAKNAQFDYDVVLCLFVKDGKYMGIVEKDRTETYERGAEIENPSYANWAKRLTADDNKGNVIVKDFGKDKEKSKVAYEETVVSEMPFKDQVADYVSKLDGQDKKEAFAKKVKALTGSGSLSTLTEEQQSKVLAYMNDNKLEAA
ncbi:AAA family ATPase [Limosilactobacillus reuteri]|uniref:AAA family ATPase n=1 Tax=Limosilactobacillus reuteri TaxID=1598 RepID=UPI001E62EAC2|nr:AAA family ATPase [Limosilactobacillus reuteri]MCC4359166.1 ATP-binding protein [Limosilactobacillus reuteri]MCC4361695.1 ATP-binding protein [Limosilactobacillus reuteri]MCC4365468.1 ATP-binding protein [Limosilactobacillus reuteri]